jgi:hypothetical protein
MSHPTEKKVEGYEVNLTPFEERYNELKLAKLEARATQSKMSQIANELVEKQKEAQEAETEFKRAKRKVEGLKEGLTELFADEMRNY